MKNYGLTANIISPYYLHEVVSDFGSVKGILLKLNLTTQNIKKLVPHENIDLTKVYQISKLLSLGELTNLPIIIGICDDGFSAILNKCKFGAMDNIIERSLAIELEKKIELIKDLILIDGHHRYTAAKQLLKSGKNVCLWCWFAPFMQLRLFSFAKVFTQNEHIKIDNLITSSYEMSIFHPVKDVEMLLHITLHLNGYYYYAFFESEEDFLCEMERLKNKLVENELILVETQEISNNEILTRINPVNHLVFRHARITHDMILNTINRGKILPLHSTCFKPKPGKISNIHSQIKLSATKYCS